MKLVVLGATGGVGLEIVRQALDQGHAVTALVRAPERLTPFGDRLRVERGDLLNCAALEQVLRGHDAVLSGFGPRVPISPSDAHLLEQFAIALTTAMPRAGVRRAVVVSTAFLFRDALLPPSHLFGRLFFPGVVADATAMEQVFAQSRADWTIVRPPRLTDAPFTGTSRVRVGHLPRFGFQIARADVADCVIKSLADPTTIGKVLGVSH